MSIPSNIAEGHTLQYSSKYLQYLAIAQASLAEVETQIEIYVRLKYVSIDGLIELNSRLDFLGKQLRALRKAVSR